MTRAVLVLVLIGAAGIGSSCGGGSSRIQAAQIGSRQARTATTLVQCPRQVVFRPVPISRVTKNAERLIPSAYVRKFHEFGRREMRGWFIEDVIWLAPPDLDHRFVNKFLRAATKTCGRRVAEASWALMIHFPNVQNPASEDVAFIARTGHGWRIYRPGWAAEYALLPYTLLPPPR